MELDLNGFEVLDREDSLRLLETATLGRLCLTSGALPTVLPVSFRLHGDTIVICTGPGRKLASATHDAVVAFEADAFDAARRSGWSVVVIGVAREVTDPDEIDRLSPIPTSRWAPLSGGRVVAISTELVAGRRVLPAVREEEVAR